jgi:DNA-binding NarL/FixJ family response regulator
MKKVQVLVIDNAEVIRQRLRYLLCDLDGVQIADCPADPEMALDHCKHFGPRCIVVDPSASAGGVALIGRLRAMSPSCAIVVNSNQGGEEFKRLSVEAGADHVFSKATEFERVAEVVRNLREAP